METSPTNDMHADYRLPHMQPFCSNFQKSFGKNFPRPSWWASCIRHLCSAFGTGFQNVVVHTQYKQNPVFPTVNGLYTTSRIHEQKIMCYTTNIISERADIKCSNNWFIWHALNNIQHIWLVNWRPPFIILPTQVAFQFTGNIKIVKYSRWEAKLQIVPTITHYYSNQLCMCAIIWINGRCEIVWVAAQ